MESQRPNDRELGNGLYAMWNGWDIAIVPAKNDGDHAIVLSRESMLKLVDFAKEVGLL